MMNEDVEMNINEMYYAVIEEEDEDGNVVYGEMQKLENAKKEIVRNTKIEKYPPTEMNP